MINLSSKIATLLALIPLVAGSVQAEVHTAACIADVEGLFYEDACTWVLVDLDNCLFEAKQALGHANWFYDLIRENMAKGLSKKEAVAQMYPEWIKTQAVCPVKPLEEDFVDLLKDLQSNGMTVMGLTHRQPSVAKATLKQAESLGVRFSESAICAETFSPEAPHPALYTSGVLFVNDNNNKGDVFSAFIDHIQKRPKKVLFIDDKMKNVLDLGDALDKMGIAYTGIHYTAIQGADPVYSRDLADFQYQFLDRILSNQEARLLMEQGESVREIE